jgi:hypothetical protein
LLQQPQETNTHCIPYRAKHTSKQDPTGTGRKTNFLPYCTIVRDCCTAGLEQGFYFVQILLLNIQKEKRHGLIQKRMSMFCICRKLSCKTGRHKNLFVKFEMIDICIGLLLLIWILKKNRSKVERWHPACCSTIPPSLGAERPRGSWQQGKKETRPFRELGIVGIVLTLVTLDDEA